MNSQDVFLTPSQGASSSGEFEKLMMELRKETNQQTRAVLTESLSEALLKPHGFEAYYEYISSFSDDSVELMSLFCKIVLSRPSKFDSDLEYLNHAKDNFSWIVHKFSIENDQQMFFTIMTKLFYFLRRNRIENQFGFFLEPIISSSNESDIFIFEKLCSIHFYVDELAEFYSGYLKHYITTYLTSKLPSASLTHCLRSGVNAINFISILEIFKDFDELDLKKILNIWLTEGSIPPQHLIESILFLTFPSYNVLEWTEKYYHHFTFSHEFIIKLQEKASNIEFDRFIWSKVADFNDVSDQIYPSNVVKKESKDILANLKSNVPTDIAFGLFEIRKLVQSDPNFIIHVDLINSLIECLFHEDSYVYANAIKTCTMIGKISTILMCDALLTILVSRFSLKNSEIVPRFVEIFNELLLNLKNNANLSTYTTKFCLLCSNYIKDSSFEIKCSIFNYYTNVLSYDCHCILLNQKEIFNSSTLSSQSTILDSDLGAEVFFKMIDAFINVVYGEGRHLVNDIVILELHQFLKSAASSAVPHVSAMAYHNLILLENIKK